MRAIFSAAVFGALLLSGCGGPVECGTDPRATLTFPTCADLDQERAHVVSESEAAMLDRCYAEQCAEDAPAEEG